MKRLILSLLCTLIVGLLPNLAFAMSCTGVTYPELIQRLKEANFPLILLEKVHVNDKELRDQDRFADCPPNSSEGETAYIYSWRPIDEYTRGLGVSFTFFEFPNAEIREKTLQKLIAADERIQAGIKAKNYGESQNKVESDVYYYVDPNSTKAFRVERDVQFVLG